MKVLLTQDIKTLGRKDEIVEVSDGYARNYLMPRGLALEANAARINDARKKEEANRNRESKELEKAKRLAGTIDSLELVIKAKTGENGKLFGSITAADIAEELKKQKGIDIDKRKIELADPIKHTCQTQAEIRLYHGVTAKLNVKVESVPH